MGKHRILVLRQAVSIDTNAVSSPAVVYEGTSTRRAKKAVHSERDLARELKLRVETHLFVLKNGVPLLHGYMLPSGADTGSWSGPTPFDLGRLEVEWEVVFGAMPD